MRWLPLLVVACSSGPNRLQASLGHVVTYDVRDARDVIIDADRTIIFTRTEAIVFEEGGAIRQVVAPATWDGSAAILRPDGTRWILGVSNERLWRITPELELQELDEALGIGAAAVIAVAAVDQTFAVAHRNGFAISRDGRHLMKIEAAPSSHIAVARDRVAIAYPKEVVVYELATGTQHSLPLPGVSALGFVDADTDRSKLFVLAETTVYREAGRDLKKLGDGVSALAIAGSRAWLRRADQLVASDGNAELVIADRRGERMLGAGMRDVWFAGATLERFGAYANPDEERWYRDVAPIFMRTCARCHVANGKGDLVLDNAVSWRDEAPAIRAQLESRAMPPAGTTTLSEQDRAVLMRWLDR